MADVHLPEIRSKNMSAIKHKNTKPELKIRKRLHALGFRYRLNSKQLPGTPDLVLSRHKAVIFVNGCFWHVHDCPVFRWPATRTAWWKEKLTKNRNRDYENIQTLLSTGWRVCTVWECSIYGRFRLPEDEVVIRIAEWLHSSQISISIEGNHD